MNLVEIDLLRSGEHTTTVPREPAVRRTGGFDYHVCVERAARPGYFVVYPIRLRDPLPVIFIPLLPEDRSVEAPLPQVFERAYDTGPYAKRPELYARPLDPPLSPEDAEWIAQRLKEAGLRG